MMECSYYKIRYFNALGLSGERYNERANDHVSLYCSYY